MTIAVCRIRLRVPESGSLKGKRQVIRSIIGRVRERFTVSIAEIEDLDSWQVASIGFACVSNDERHANAMVSEIAAFVERLHADAEVLDVETELIHAL
jgi:uncharacterized protein YlxP (DUF503 family)